MDIDLNDPMATDGGKALTYNRMEAKPIAGEHCRFCGRERVPLVKTRCCEQWICCDTAFMSFRGGGYCQFEHENDSACHFHYNEGHQGSLQDCGECRRFFGEDEFKRRREGPGNEALYEMKSIEIGERRGQIPGKKYCPLRLGFRRLIPEQGDDTERQRSAAPGKLKRSGRWRQSAAGQL
jgi:hypothetical protein